MSLTGLKSQLATLKSQVPPPKGKPPVVVYATKGPSPADEPADTDTVKRWFYADLAELEELRARFDREFGPATRNPNDPPCLFFRVISQAEIFEEQYKGTPYEHLWMGGPTSDAEVQP